MVEWLVVDRFNMDGADLERCSRRGVRIVQAHQGLALRLREIQQQNLLA